MIRTLLICLLIVIKSTLLSGQVLAGTEINLTNSQYEDRYASYSPDGKSIVFESNRLGNWNIFMMQSDGSQLTQLSYSDSEDRRPSWHPDGSAVLFESMRSGFMELYSLDIKDKTEHRITHFDGRLEPIFSSYSPDGKSIAVSLRETDDKSGIYVLSESGKIKEQICTRDYRSYYPRWSPDGKRLVYFSRKDTNNKTDALYIFNLSTQEESRISYRVKHSFCPSWSQDGQRIIYTQSMEDRRPELYLYDMSTSESVKLTDNDEGETEASFCPTGDKLLMTAFRNGNYEICELKLEKD